MLGGCTMSEQAETVRDDLRRVAWCEFAAIDAAAKLLDDREIVILAGRLDAIATHLSSRAGDGHPVPPQGAVPGTGPDRIDLTVQWDSVTVAGWFVRNTLTRWLWADVLFNAELVTYELTKAFVGTVQDCEPADPTAMTIRLRAISANRLVVEVHDSPGNAAVLGEAEELISECVQDVSVRSGVFRRHGRTTVWCELARPEGDRWI
ncbi:hypothetical protein ABIA39_004384 [Nocardia sp. GAS34]